MDAVAVSAPLLVVAPCPVGIVPGRSRSFVGTPPCPGFCFLDHSFHLDTVPTTFLLLLLFIICLLSYAIFHKVYVASNWSLKAGVISCSFDSEPLD